MDGYEQEFKYNTVSQLIEYTDESDKKRIIRITQMDFGKIKITWFHLITITANIHIRIFTMIKMAE